MFHFDIETSIKIIWVEIDFYRRDAHRDRIGAKLFDILSRHPPRLRKINTYAPFRIWKFIPVFSPIMQQLVGKKIQFNFFLVAAAVAQSVKCPGLRSLTRGATELT